jgi:hypothetical protein
LLVPLQIQEASMNRRNVPSQSDLFTGDPAPPVVTSLQRHHDELVDLVSKLLQEVVLDPLVQVEKEKDHEQDQC